MRVNWFEHCELLNFFYLDVRDCVFIVKIRLEFAKSSCSEFVFFFFFSGFYFSCFSNTSFEANS